MAKPSMYQQEGGFSQRSQRRVGTIFRDQHDRAYHAVIETKTGHPCGPLEPRFTAPLMPPQMYLVVGTNPERPYDLRINYDGWLADLRTAHAEWKQRGEKLARLVHGEKYVAGAAFTRQVLEELGPPPQHVEPVIAAKQGNAYVLGLTDRVDIRLAAMLEDDKPARGLVAEPDFSEVVEALDEDDDLAALDDEEEARKERIRAQDRARKAAKRDARRQAAEAA